ncbi:MAG TPA: hypothetical protein IAC00_07120 [Candidatus Limivicinus faecipullorum]|nr:hypothetical protein [Candidatus Limivicinus faecipullorum]
MKLFKKGKNQLDEMQEQNLRKLESWGFWLTWGALLLSIMIQMLIYKEEAGKYLKGEWIVFMASNLYMVIGCVRLGIWSRRGIPSFKSLCLISLLAGLVTGIFVAVYNYLIYGDVLTALATVILASLFTFVLCLLVLVVSVSAYKKRRQKLDSEGDEK